MRGDHRFLRLQQQLNLVPNLFSPTKPLVLCAAMCQTAVGTAKAAIAPVGCSSNWLDVQFYVMMRVLRQYGVLVLLLVTCFTPAIACTIPDAQMSPQERTCCHTMKDQCGQMEMPASHGCCQKTPPSIHDNALVTKIVAFHPITLTGIWRTTSELLNQNSAVTGWVERPDYSPPKSPPSTISILRI